MYLIAMKFREILFREVIKNCCAILIEAKEDSKADIMEEMGIHNKLITLIK